MKNLKVLAELAVLLGEVYLDYTKKGKNKKKKK